MILSIIAYVFVTTVVGWTALAALVWMVDKNADRNDTTKD